MASSNFIFNSQEETERFAASLAHKLEPPLAIALLGEVGAGKTTFVRAFVKSLKNGDKVRVKSPSYALHHEYATTPEVHHLDLYRLTDTRQIEDLGLIDLIQNTHGFILIEWPEAVISQLPANSIHLHFEYIRDNIRQVTLGKFPKRTS